jgi:hypothetical protein
MPASTSKNRSQFVFRPTSILAAFALIALSSLNASGSGHPSSGLRVGVCVRDITPVTPGLAAEYEAAFGGPVVVNHSDPVWMAGFGNGRAATGYNDQLWARGVVVDGKGGRVAIVSVDLVGYFVNEVETIRALVSPDSGVEYLVVSSTHQHEGPDTLGIWGPDEVTTGIDFGYLDFVNAAVADCVDEAAANLQLARIKYATTDSEGLSLGLDVEDDGFGVGDGKVLAGDDLLAPETDGRIVDPRLSILQFTRRGAGRPVIATLVNFASHPESLGSNNTLITSDFPHYSRERIEAALGGTAIWVSGDLGVLQGPLDLDVLDPVTEQPAVRRTFRWSQVHGEQLADRVVAAIADGKPGAPTADISFASTSPVAVRLDNPFFHFLFAVGVIDVRRSLYTNGVPDPSVGFPFPPPFDAIPQALGEDLQTEVGALRIGAGSFAIVPTELDPQIGEAYRGAMLGAEHTFIIGLGNDEIGYQLPADKWDDSCHACAPFILAGASEFCPLFPNIDCNTVFQNNAGQAVDPAISGALLPLIQDLH